MLPVKSFLEPSVWRFLDDEWTNMFDWSNRHFSDTRTTLPSVNIKETPDEFIVEMAAPGMRKDDFQIELHNNMLTIRSEVKREDMLPEGERYNRREFSYQSFQRTFALNQRVVDDGRIEAKYENGILRLALPKREEAREKPARIIEIS